jgi:hypothetical protein
MDAKVNHKGYFSKCTTLPVMISRDAQRMMLSQQWIKAIIHLPSMVSRKKMFLFVLG